MIIGAIICKDIKIKGFKNDRQTKRLLARMEANNASNNNVLIFKLNSNSYKISSDPSLIETSSLNVIAYILQPIKPFP